MGAGRYGMVAGCRIGVMVAGWWWAVDCLVKVGDLRGESVDLGIGLMELCREGVKQHLVFWWEGER